MARLDQTSEIGRGVDTPQIGPQDIRNRDPRDVGPPDQRPHRSVVSSQRIANHRKPRSRGISRERVELGSALRAKKSRDGRITVVEQRTQSVGRHPRFEEANNSNSKIPLRQSLPRLTSASDATRAVIALPSPSTPTLMEQPVEQYPQVVYTHCLSGLPGMGFFLQRPKSTVLPDGG